MMKKLVRDYYFLKKGERVALIFISGILILSIGFRLWVNSRPAPDIPENLELRRKMDSLLQLLVIQDSLDRLEKVANQINKEKESHTEYFAFNPNSICYDSLLILGLTPFAASNIVKYRKAGGHYESIDDLKKVYGLEEEYIENLAEYLEFGTDPDVHITPREIPVEVLPTDTFELNMADSIQLMNLKGIGPSYAGRILKYRELLGGYVSHGQLWEVYGMDSTRFVVLVKHSYINQEKIRKIPLNSTTFSELIRHPYMDKASTYALLQYRNFRDSLDSVDDLLNDQILDQYIFKRMRPYFGLNSSE